MAKEKRKTRDRAVTLLLALGLGVSLLLSGCGQTTTSRTLSAADRLALQRGYILIGLVTAKTGPVAGFGEAVDWVTNRCLDAMNKDGGIYVKSLGKKLPVKVLLRDTQSSPTIAASVAAELITKDKADVVMPLWTPDVVNPVSAICERYHTPCIALGAPQDSWLAGGPYHWTYACLSQVNNVAAVNIGLWRSVGDKTDKVVGLLFPNDADGTSWAKVYNQKLPAAGFKVVDPGRFPNNTNDFSALISRFKQAHVDIVKGTVPPPVFAVFWRQAHEQGYVPKMCDVSEADLFPSDVASFGDDLGYGLTTEVFWGPFLPLKSSLTGETAGELCDAWTKATGKEWTQTLGQDYAAFEIAADVLKRTQSLDPADLVAAIGQTDLKTISWLEPVQFNDQHVSNGPVVSGQWVHGRTWPWELQVVYTNGIAGIQTKPLVFPLPRP